jgi:uncharacterized protein (TIGR02217 family)
MPFTIIPDTLPRFPTDISFEHPGGPIFNTDVAILDSGNEQRNSFWEEPRYEWEVGYDARDTAKIYTLLNFFMALRGQWRKLRWKDWTDYATPTVPTYAFVNLAIKVTNITPLDQSLGIATAGQTQFQLIKTYGVGDYSTVMRITRPIGSTVRIAVDGTEVTTGWTVDETTGIVTRSSGLAGGEEVTWGGEFDRPVRLGTDELKQSFKHWKIAGMQLPIMGLRE